MSEMNRRDTLKLIAVLCAVPGFTILSSCQRPFENPPLDGLNTDEIKKYGRAYLEKYPKDKEVSVVQEVLNNTSQSENDAIKYFQELMIKDFKHNHTINLLGWNLSKTEGQIFAAATITIMARK